MNKIFKYMTVGLCLFVFFACEEIEDDPLDLKSDIYVWDEYDYTGQYAIEWLNGIYSFVPTAYNRVGGQPQEVLTDDAVPTSSTNTNWTFINSGYAPNSMFALSQRLAPDEYGESWTICYKAIRRANVFMENCYRVPWSDMGEADYYYYEARALRAYFYMLLVREYGGVPLIGDNIFDANSPELYALTRSSFEDCVNYIISEFDAVKDHLRSYSSISDRAMPEGDNLASTSSADGSDANYTMIRKYGVLGLKARLLLLAASPLFNASEYSDKPETGYSAYDAERWKAAADVCQEIIQSGMFMLEPDRTRLSRSWVNREVLWLKPGQKNDVYARSWGYLNSPMGTLTPYTHGTTGTYCEGITSPTQELVDAFPMNDGRSITEAQATGDYNPQNPYINRDPRLAKTVFFHGSRWLGRTLDMSEGGADRSNDPNRLLMRTKTGYYLKRHLANNEETTTFGATNFHATQPGAFMQVRYADILLMYAEAMNEYRDDAGMREDLVRLSLIPIRARAGILPGSNNRYGIPANPSQGQLRELIRNERRIELAFEESRFWDIRRWKIADQVYGNGLHGVIITKNTDGTFEYTYNGQVARPFWDKKMYLFPVDEKEILVNRNLVQNPGY
jgi:hypothetical protein